MSKPNILNALTQISPQISHPNRASPLATANPITQSTFLSNLKGLGFANAAQLPKSFDWRKQPNVTLAPVMNQGHCGSCYAMSTAGAMSDRWIIMGGSPIAFNPLPLLVCAPSAMCAGGAPEGFQTYLEKVGLTPNKTNSSCLSWEDYCSQYADCCPNCTATNSNSYPPMSCEQLNCTGGYKVKPNSMRAGTVLDASNNVDRVATIDSIKTDILKGCVISKYQVFGDFMVADAGLVTAGGQSFSWKETNGIYINGMYDKSLSTIFKDIAANTGQNSDIDPEKIKVLSQGLMPSISGNQQNVSAPSTTSMGFHAVEIVGWDVDPIYGEYWIVKNSWGGSWNGDGYFKFGMNTDGKRNSACGMDIPMTTPSGLFGGTLSFLPDIPNPVPRPLVNPSSPTSSSSSKLWILWLILGIILIVSGAIFVYIFIIKRKKKVSFIQVPVIEQTPQPSPIPSKIPSSIPSPIPSKIPIQQTPIPSIPQEPALIYTPTSKMSSTPTSIYIQQLGMPQSYSPSTPVNTKI
jgi:hypothetical protein